VSVFGGRIQGTESFQIAFLFFYMYQEEGVGGDIFSLINIRHIPHSTSQKIRTMLANVRVNFAMASFCSGFVQLHIKCTARKGMKSRGAGHGRDWDTTCSTEK